MKTRRKPLVAVLCTLLLSVVCFPELSSAGALKVKHALSIYSDGGIETDIPLRDPEGVVCRVGSFLFVSDTGNGRLLRYSFEGDDVNPQALVIAGPELVYPQKIVVSSQDVLYVFDGNQRGILRYSLEGEFLGLLAPGGVPSPGITALRTFTIDSEDNVYLLDIRSERVVVLSPEGAYKREIAFPPDYGFFTDVAVDFKGSVFLTDSVSGAVFHAPRGASRFALLTDALKNYGRFFTFLSIDARGRIFLVDRNGSQLVVLGPDGAFAGSQSGKGWKDGLLNYPAQICLSIEGVVFIADTKNHRVQMFSVSE